MKILTFDTSLNKTYITYGEDEKIITSKAINSSDEKYHSVRMIVPEKFNGDVKALPALSPNEIKTILKRNFYWASTIKTPFLTGEQVEMLIRELKKKHV